MPTFRPFRGIRPSEEYVGNFPSLPIESLSDQDYLTLSEDKTTYVNMVSPAEKGKAADLDKSLKKVRTNFEDLIENKVLMQDVSAYYLYEQILPNKTVYRGLLGLVSVEDFINGKIKKHESTLTERKQQLAKYLDRVNIQAEPVLLTYNSNPKVELIMNNEEKTVPVMNYTSPNGIRHKLWRIDNRLKIQQLKEALDPIESFYIADGHHRMGSTALLAQSRNEKAKKTFGSEPHNFVLSYIVSKDSIKIHDYNRLIKDLNGLTEEEFLKKLEKSFLINEKGSEPYFPSKKFHISMYLGGKFYSLHVKHELRQAEMENLRDFDHYLLEKYVIDEILNIEDFRTTDRINYVRGNSTLDGILQLKDMVDSGEYEVGFGVHPISYNDLVKISENSIEMPPKCTLIEPKVISALVMYDMK